MILLFGITFCQPTMIINSHEKSIRIRYYHSFNINRNMLQRHFCQEIPLPNENCKFFFSNWIGGDICETDLNVKPCSYDGGDCCGQNILMIRCYTCMCFCKVTQIIDERENNISFALLLIAYGSKAIIPISTPF